MVCSMFMALGTDTKATEMSLTELGMHYFVSLSSDEIKAAKPVVRIPSLADNGSIEENNICTNRTVFIIPGIEGK